MRYEAFSFGSIRIDGVTYDHDVVIDRAEVRKRKKKPSKKFRDQFGHTPLSLEEEIPWQCRQLVIGSGAYGRLPVMQGSTARSRASQNQITCSAHCRSNQGVEGRAQRHQRDSSRYVLNVCPSEVGCTISIAIDTAHGPA